MTARRKREIDAGAGRTSEPDERRQIVEPARSRIARRCNQTQNVQLDFLVKMDRVQRFAHLQNVFECCHRRNSRDRVRASDSAHDLVLFIVRRIFDEEFEHEPVHLRFRQRVSALLLDRILCCQHHERLRQLVRLPAERNLPFLHRLQQRALHLGGRAVDFVCKHDVGEDRSLMSFERAGLMPVNLRTDQVTGQQVGSKLNATELSTQRLCQRVDHHRFGDAGNAFQQRMAVAQHGDQHFLQWVALAHDDLAKPLQGRC